MGGRAAEEILFHEVTGGASNDFEAANQIATAMVTKWGMGRDPEADRGRHRPAAARSRSSSRPASGPSRPRSRPAATRAIRAILDDAYAEAIRTLIAHMARCAGSPPTSSSTSGSTARRSTSCSTDASRSPTADGEWRAATSRPRDWGDILPFRERRGRAPVVVPAPSDALDAPTPIPLPIPAAIALDGLPGGELIEEPGAAGAASVAAQPSEPLAESIATSSAALIEDGAWASTPSIGDAAPASTGPARRTAARARSASKVARAFGTPTGRRMRRLAAGLLASAEARVRPGEPEPER